LLPPKTLQEASYVFSHSAEFAKTIEYVKDYFDYTIIDTPPRYYDTLREIIEISNQVFAVVTSEANSIILLKQFREEIMKQGVPFDAKVIMNKRNKKALSVIGSDLRAILPEGTFATVEDDPTQVALSYNNGIPVIVSHTKSKLRDDLVSLVKAIAQVVENG
jgi:pilus assembly protein CpaE